MQKKDFLKWSGIVAIVLLTLVAVGTALGQEPDPNQGPPPATTLEPREFPDRVDQGSEGQVGVAGEVGIQAQPPVTMNYQGYVTDGSGNLLDGVYTLDFSLYDAATGGFLEWGPETHANVQVIGGLFSVALGEFVPLTPEDFYEALFLEVSIDGATLATRQPVRPVAYAFGLAPGAQVVGGPSASLYALTVVNTDYTSGTGSGLYASGDEYGIYAEELGTGDVGIYSPDFVEAQGYKSADDSYLWVPGISGVPAPSSNLNVNTSYSGRVSLTASSIGTKYFYLPVNMPGELYGQEVTVEELRVYYYTSNSASYIAETNMVKLTGAGFSDYTTLIDNDTNWTSTIPTSYSMTTTGSNMVTYSSGPIRVQLQLYFSNTSHTIYIGAIRLRLGHMD